MYTLNVPIGLNGRKRPSVWGLLASICPVYVCMPQNKKVQKSEGAYLASFRGINLMYTLKRGQKCHVYLAFYVR